MRVKILKRSFAGAEFAPDVRVLKVGGQSSAGVEKLEFELPAEWQGLSVTLHVQWLDGTLPAPVLLDDEDSVAVDKTMTASPGGQWMLLALGADGYRALTKPTKYECYSTLNTDGDVEISPTQYETFVARVLEYSNTAQQAAASAKTNAETAATAATRAVNAKGQAETAARTATAGAESSENSAARAEAAAHRAELAAPETGKVVSVNGKGGAVHLTAEDVGAMPASGAAVVQSIRLEGRTLTVTICIKKIPDRDPRKIGILPKIGILQVTRIEFGTIFKCQPFRAFALRRFRSGGFCLCRFACTGRNPDTGRRRPYIFVFLCVYHLRKTFVVLRTAAQQKRHEQ